VRLTWAPLAIADRESIFDYIAIDNVEAAVELDELFQRKAALIGEHPEVGKPGRVPGTREFVAHRHYVFAYDFGPQRVRVLRILHTALQWPPPKPRASSRRKRSP
jgi:plasmid stabilization system protein ParE